MQHGPFTLPRGLGIPPPPPPTGTRPPHAAALPVRCKTGLDTRACACTYVPCCRFIQTPPYVRLDVNKRQTAGWGGGTEKTRFLPTVRLVPHLVPSTLQNTRAPSFCRTGQTPGMITRHLTFVANMAPAPRAGRHPSRQTRHTAACSNRHTVRFFACWLVHDLRHFHGIYLAAGALFLKR